MGNDAVRALLPGVSSSQTLATTAPESNGIYWAGACIDPVEGEINTMNQCSTGVQVIVAALVDTDGDVTIENPITSDVNFYDTEAADCGGLLTNLNDFDDWGNIYFGDLGDADGAMVGPREIITEQPVPTEYLNGID